MPNHLRILMLNMQGAGVGYYRHTLPAHALSTRGHSITHWPASSNALLEMGDYERWLHTHIRDYDLIHTGYSTDIEVVQLLTAVREYAAIPIITDIDDDITHVPPYNLAFMKYHAGARERKFALMHLHVSDAVTTSTTPLTDVLRSHSRRITTLPNCHDPAAWDGLDVAPDRWDDKHVRMLFAGGQGRLDDLNEVREPVEWAMDHYPHLRLFFLSLLPDWAAKYMPSSSDPHANRAFYLQPSPLTTYRAILRWVSPDIMFAPVAPNTFNESKSCIKAYDAAECGAALITSDWPTYAPVPNNCALKASTPYQWRESLAALIESEELRRMLHLRLQGWARETMHIDRHIHKWEIYYRQVLEGGLVKSINDIVQPQRDGVTHGILPNPPRHA